MKESSVQRTRNGHRDIGDILCEAWGDESRELTKNSRRLAKKYVYRYEGTLDNATANRDMTPWRSRNE